MDKRLSIGETSVAQAPLVCRAGRPKAQNAYGHVCLITHKAWSPVADDPGYDNLRIAGLFSARLQDAPSQIFAGWWRVALLQVARRHLDPPNAPTTPDGGVWTWQEPVNAHDAQNASTRRCRT